jgi:hypothetical protein
MTIASFFQSSKIDVEKEKRYSQMAEKRLKEKEINAFVNVCEGDKVPVEMRQMLKYYGLGPLKPNTVLFGGITVDEEADEFAETIQYALNRSYNVVIVNDEKKNEAAEMAESGADIHIWWDDNDEESSELMLVFSYMIQRNPLRKKCKICLKTIVPDERARHGKMKYFEELSLKLRLPLDIEAYVSPEPEKARLEFMHLFSKQADIIFLPLKAPNEAEESYVDYLKKMSKLTDKNPNIVLVASSDHTPLESILL